MRALADRDEEAHWTSRDPHTQREALDRDPVVGEETSGIRISSTKLAWDAEQVVLPHD
jgi:hypothetical protein